MIKISDHYLVALYTFSSLSIFSQNDLKYPKDFNVNQATNICFIENKGQAHDQNYKPRTDILFSGTDGKIVYHFKNNGLSYQLSKTDSKKTTKPKFSGHTGAIIQTQPDQISICRLDINWLNSNQNSKIIKGSPNKDYDNYYLENCPNGALQVKNYSEITYQNIYTGIDLKWHGQDGHLKYDYIIAAGADYKQIQFEIEGAESIYINQQGELEIKTLLGLIIEQAPLVIQNTQHLKAKWVIKNNVVSYDIKKIDPKQSFIIDPMVRSWGTYYGAGSSNGYLHCTTDSLNNVYLAGVSGSNSGNTLATSGSYQSAFAGQADAYLVKFDSAGVRLWGTYYGGSASDNATSCATDINNNVYLTGYTASGLNNATVIATPGSHQPVYMGQHDGFLVKFDAAGIRQWGTYYGGLDFDEVSSCTTDLVGNVYCVGYTGSNTGISTPGSHQSALSAQGQGQQGDAFLVKFNTNGVRQWATYYGVAGGQEYGNKCAIDISNNIYMAGNTRSSSGIGTPASHQPSYGGLNDAFLVKFNQAGTRQWATYYGGNGDEEAWGCAIDGTDVYLSGYTYSANGSVITTSGSHQPIHGGGTIDGFLVKFNGSGIRQWGTYYGGAGQDYGTNCTVDIYHNVFMSGISNSPSGIATTCSHQPTLGGNQDAFLVKFNSNGLQQWGTYYGGPDNDYGRSCATDRDHHIYLAGNASNWSTNAGTIIATPGSFQSTSLNGGDFIVNFLDDNSTVVNILPPQNQTICANNSATLSAISNGTVTWYNTPSGGTAISTGSTITTPVLSTGTYTYYLESTNCISTTTRTAVAVTVNALPIIAIAIASSTICAGNSTSISATGASTYSWSPSASLSSATGASVIANPPITTNYTVTGSTGNCVSSQTISIVLNAIPNLILSVTATPTICLGNVISLGVTGASSYVWSPSTGLNSTTLANVIASPSIVTQYTVTGYNGNCTDTKTIDVFVNPPFNIAVSVTSYSICSGHSTTLYATGASDFSWLPGLGLSATNGSLIIANPNTTTVYTVTGYQNNCYNSQQFTVTVAPSPVINLTSDLIIYEGDSVTLLASGGNTYNWSPNENLSCTNCNSTIASPIKSTSYCVEITDTNSCTNSKCVNITVDINCGELFLPNAFSPNEDGINDVLHVKINPKCVSSFNILIFDRWGEKVFESDDLNFSWDGTFRGKALNTAVFVYQLKLKLLNKELLSKKGNITLIK